VSKFSSNSLFYKSNLFNNFLKKKNVIIKKKKKKKCKKKKKKRLHEKICVYKIIVKLNILKFIRSCGKYIYMIVFSNQSFIH